MTTCVIIEDDRLAMESLRQLITTNFCEELMLVGIASNARDGMKLIHNKSPELIFLDIELPDGNGFNLLSQLSDYKFEVIFATASHDYAISALRHSAIDYLIKPINLIDLRGAVIRLENKKKTLKPKKVNVQNISENFRMGISLCEKIALPTSDGFQLVRLNEILYCQASENYTYIYTVNGDSYFITKTLKNIEELLSSVCFFRIHKSTLLNINYVKSFSRRDGFVVILENEQKFEVATRRQEEFINLFLRKNSEIKNSNGDFRYTGETLN